MTMHVWIYNQGCLLINVVSQNGIICDTNVKCSCTISSRLEMQHESKRMIIKKMEWRIVGIVSVEL